MGSAYANGVEDPFAAPATYPAVKFPTPGAEVDMFITEIGELRQARDFETGAPSVSKKGNPKMQLRILGDVDGVEMALYVPQFSNLWNAIREARNACQQPLAPMGRLWVKYVADVPVENAPHLKAKGYTAKYLPPKGQDPWAEVVEAPKAGSTTAGSTSDTAPAASEAPF